MWAWSAKPVSAAISASGASRVTIAVHAPRPGLDPEARGGDAVAVAEPAEGGLAGHALVAGPGLDPRRVVARQRLGHQVGRVGQGGLAGQQGLQQGGGRLARVALGQAGQQVRIGGAGHAGQVVDHGRQRQAEDQRLAGDLVTMAGKGPVDQHVAGPHPPAAPLARLLVAAGQHHGGIGLVMDMARNGLARGQGLAKVGAGARHAGTLAGWAGQAA
jgi:hypothetical protein